MLFYFFLTTQIFVTRSAIYFVVAKSCIRMDLKKQRYVESYIGQTFECNIYEGLYCTQQKGQEDSQSSPTCYINLT